MWKVALALGGLLTLSAPVAADGTGDKPVRMALFQPKNIFHSGLRNEHTIALTFDDGPNAHTSEVLDALKDRHVKATFFIVGQQAHRHPDVLARIAREGHLLANRSATHAFLGSRSYDENPEALIAQIRDVHDQIAPLMAKGDKFYFRAPYGAWRKGHADILNADPELRRYVGPIYWDEGGDIAMSAATAMSWLGGLGLLAHGLVGADLRLGVYPRDSPQGWRRGADALHSPALGRAGAPGGAGPDRGGLQVRASRPDAGIPPV